MKQKQKQMNFGNFRNVKGQIYYIIGGAGNPTLTAFRNNVFGLTFSDNALRSVYCYFQLNHDYKVGTSIYPYINVSTTTTNTGNMVWLFEYTIGKGYNQGTNSVFDTTTVQTITYTVTTNSQYENITVEGNAISSTKLDIDSCILMRVSRTNTGNTLAGNLWLWDCNLHYECDKYSTPNRVNPFL